MISERRADELRRMSQDELIALLLETERQRDLAARLVETERAAHRRVRAALEAAGAWLDDLIFTGPAAPESRRMQYEMYDPSAPTASQLSAQIRAALAKADAG